MQAVSLVTFKVLKNFVIGWVTAFKLETGTVDLRCSKVVPSFSFCTSLGSLHFTLSYDTGLSNHSSDKFIANTDRDQSPTIASPPPDLPNGGMSD